MKAVTDTMATNRTSWHGTTVEASVDEILTLAHLLGADKQEAGFYGPADGCDKSSYSLSFLNFDEQPFTCYDWKNPPTSQFGNHTWHIGAHTKAAADNGADEMRMLLADLRQGVVYDFDRLGEMRGNSNSFELLANWKRAALSQGHSASFVKAVLSQATSGDRTHLVEVLDYYSAPTCPHHAPTFGGR